MYVPVLLLGRIVALPQKRGHVWVPPFQAPRTGRSVLGVLATLQRTMILDALPSDGLNRKSCITVLGFLVCGSKSCVAASSASSTFRQLLVESGQN